MTKTWSWLAVLVGAALLGSCGGGGGSSGGCWQIRPDLCQCWFSGGSTVGTKVDTCAPSTVSSGPAAYTPVCCGTIDWPEGGSCICTTHAVGYQSCASIDQTNMYSKSSCAMNGDFTS